MQWAAVAVVVLVCIILAGFGCAAGCGRRPPLAGSGFTLVKEHRGPYGPVTVVSRSATLGGARIPVGVSADRPVHYVAPNRSVVIPVNDVDNAEVRWVGMRTGASRAQTVTPGTAYYVDRDYLRENHDATAPAGAVRLSNYTGEPVYATSGRHLQLNRGGPLAVPHSTRLHVARFGDAASTRVGAGQIVRLDDPLFGGWWNRPLVSRAARTRHPVRRWISGSGLLA